MALRTTMHAQGAGLSHLTDFRAKATPAACRSQTPHASVTRWANATATPWHKAPGLDRRKGVREMFKKLASEAKCTCGYKLRLAFERESKGSHPRGFHEANLCLNNVSILCVGVRGHQAPSLVHGSLPFATHELTLPNHEGQLPLVSHCRFPTACANRSKALL